MSGYSTNEMMEYGTDGPHYGTNPVYAYDIEAGQQMNPTRRARNLLIDQGVTLGVNALYYGGTALYKTGVDYIGNKIYSSIKKIKKKTSMKRKLAPGKFHKSKTVKHFKKKKLGNNMRISGNFKRYVGKEVKYKDVVTTADNVNHGTPFHIPSYNLIGAGTKPGERIGRKIQALTLDVNIHLKKKANGNSEGTSQTYRIIFYMDKQCNGTSATTSQILQDGSNIYSFNNLENSSRFVILKNKFVTLNSPTTFVTAPAQTTAGSAQISSGNVEVNRNFRFRLKIPCAIEFGNDTNTTAITDIKSCNIGSFITAEDNNSNTESKIVHRFRFTG